MMRLKIYSKDLAVGRTDAVYLIPSKLLCLEKTSFTGIKAQSPAVG